MVTYADEGQELAAFARSVAETETDRERERTPVVVIAGCGGGRTVTALRKHGVEAYGFDAERSILESVPNPTREWLLEADIREAELIGRLCETFGIDRIDCFVTECMLSFLAPEEATVTLARIRNEPEVGRLLHRIRLDPPVCAQEGGIEATILTPAAWQKACDPDGVDVWREAFEPWNLPA